MSWRGSRYVDRRTAFNVITMSNDLAVVAERPKLFGFDEAAELETISAHLKDVGTRRALRLDDKRLRKRAKEM
jgi:hypothetical protein